MGNAQVRGDGNHRGAEQVGCHDGPPGGQTVGGATGGGRDNDAIARRREDVVSIDRHGDPHRARDEPAGHHHLVDGLRAQDHLTGTLDLYAQDHPFLDLVCPGQQRRERSFYLVRFHLGQEPETAEVHPQDGHLKGRDAAHGPHNGTVPTQGDQQV